VAYANPQSVRARLGRLARALEGPHAPTDGDLEIFLDEASSELDAALVARGASLPLATDVAAALQGLVADMALLKVLPALYPAGPGKPGGQEAEMLVSQTAARVSAAWKAIDAGRLPALVLVQKQTETGGGASSFWQDEGAYPLDDLVAARAGWPYGDGSLQPAIRRSSRF
jgi:hypothetical protein